MDALTIVVAAVSAAGAVASAIVAIYIARLTKDTVAAYNQQVKIGQDQIKASQAQTFNQARPILAPPDISGLLKNDQGKIFVSWGQGQSTIGGLQNIGAGPAFNIYGIFFGVPFQNIPPRERYVIWNYDFLPPGGSGKEATLSQGTSIKSENTINGYTLYVPDDSDHIGRICRLTLSYHDIYGRKLVSMYDYQNILGWICLGHFEGVERDLYELEALEPMTQQSNQFFYAMGKMHR